MQSTFVMQHIRLDPPIPLSTPKGKAYAHFMIDYSQEHDLLWVTFLNDTGQCWTFKNSEILLDANYTMGIRQNNAAPSNVKNMF